MLYFAQVYLRKIAGRCLVIVFYALFFVISQQVTIMSSSTAERAVS